MNADDPLKLENQLCFPLYACAKEVVRRYAPLLDTLGITYTQYIALMVLWERKSANVKTLGELLFLDSGTLTPLLKKMEAQGLVTRKRSEADERNVVVTLTKKGEALRDKAAKVPAKARLCIGIDPDEAKTLYALLYKVLGNFPDKQ